MDTIQPRRCGCVPQLSLVYDERSRGGGGGGGLALGDEGWEEVGGGESPPQREGWARKIPLLGPFWCVRGSATTTIRRRLDFKTILMMMMMMTTSWWNYLQNLRRIPVGLGGGAFLRRIMILGGAAAWTIPAYPSVHLWTWAQHQYQHQHGNNVSLTFSTSISICIGISISICNTATASLS